MSGQSSSPPERGRPARFILRHWSLVIGHWSFIPAVLLALATTACGPSAATEARETAPDYRPAVLRIGWVPNEEDVERRIRWEGLTSYLSRKLGLPVELVQTASYSPAIEALRARKLEVVGLGPFAFLIAESRGVATPLVLAGTAEGHPRVYTSGLIVPATSPIHTVDDIKARAAELTFTWTDPASNSGHLVPRAFLESIGINAERDFRQVMFSMGHTASILTVKAGKVDLAGISTTSLKSMLDRGRLAPGDVRLIWESEPLITGIIGIRTGLPAAFRAEVLAAYLAFADEDPAAWAKIAALYTEPGVRWVAATSDHIEPLRRLARNVQHIDLLEQ